MMLKAPIVVIDGPSGAGKTTLAAALAAALDGGLAGGTQVVHLDDLYQGWADGPDGGAARLAEQVLTPLVTGQSATYYRYNWQAGCFADEPVFVHPDRPVVVEG
ncbi:MAG: uridine kinase, partial [Cellulomonadaceae bacterium]|nr:uridine kinase [Cellulomonadaceae bacterium]